MLGSIVKLFVRPLVRIELHKCSLFNIYRLCVPRSGTGSVRSAQPDHGRLQGGELRRLPPLRLGREGGLPGGAGGVPVRPGESYLGGLITRVLRVSLSRRQRDRSL